MVVGDISTGTGVLVIGGGPAGYTAAIRCGQLDLDVTLVERSAVGGTCLTTGCIPSKALITATDVAYEASEAEHMGIHADPVVDVAQLFSWKDGIVDQLTSGVEKLCEANGVSIIDGTAEFVDEDTARVAHADEGRGSESIQFEHAIIATGSRPMEIPGFEIDGDRIVSSTEALDIESAPDALLIIGGGYIGMELAGVYAKIGTEVTVVEMLDSILPGYDSDLTRPVERQARRLGIEIHTETVADEWKQTPDDRVRVMTKMANGDSSEEYVVDAVLVAVGRQPVTTTVNLDAVDVETDDNGFIQTDEQMRTGVEHIFAVGDVAGEPMLAHKGMTEGEVAAAAIAGEPAAFDYQAVPAAVFTDPEIATVGLTAEAAEDEGFSVVIGQFPFRASGRALSIGSTDGFVKIVADAESGFILGGQVVGPEASELIAEIGVAIEFGATLADISGTIHTHPTLSEAVREAAEHAQGQAIHTLNR